MTGEKTIAILLAVYNGDEFLEELIDSIMHQTYQDFICYIHDDGSSDRSVQVLSELKQKYPEKMVILDYPPTGSAKANFFSLLRERTEKYIMFADQDDVWLPEKIEKTFAAIRAIENDGETPALVFTDLRIVDKELNTIAPSFMRRVPDRDPNRLQYQQLLRLNVGVGCTIMINRSLASLCTKPANTDLIYMHDWWAMLLASIYGKISYLDETTILYRQHDNNVVGVRTKTKRFSDKVKDNIALIQSGEFVRSKSLWTDQCRQMATVLLQYDDLPSDVRKTLMRLVQLESRPKVFRILFYVKNGFLKKRKNLWMLLWV